MMNMHHPDDDSSPVSSDSDGVGPGPYPGVPLARGRSPITADMYRSAAADYQHRPEMGLHLGQNPAALHSGMFNPSSLPEGLPGYSYPGAGVEGWLNQTALWSQPPPPIAPPWSGPFYMGGLQGMGAPVSASSPAASPAPSPAPSPAIKQEPISGPKGSGSASGTQEVHVPWLGREGFVIKRSTLSSPEWWKRLESANRESDRVDPRDAGKLCFVPTHLVRTACSTVCVSQPDLNDDPAYNDDLEHGQPRAPFGCPLCEKTFTAPHKMKLHLLTHSHDHPHTCFHCLAVFKSPEELSEHRKPLMNPEGTTHTCICPECGEVLRSPECLRLHGLCHSPGWPLLCVACCRVISDSQEIKAHLALHEAQSAAPRWSPMMPSMHSLPHNPYHREAPHVMPGQAHVGYAEHSNHTSVHT